MTAKADNIKRLLEDPNLEEAFENVRRFYLEKIEDLPLDQKNGAGALYDIRKQLYLLRQVKDDLAKAIQHGNYEDFVAAQSEQPSFLGDIRKWRHRKTV